MTLPSGNNELDTLRRILFGADVARLDQAIADHRSATGVRVADLEQKMERALAELDERVQRRLDELSQRVTAQLDDLSHRQQAHADRATQLLDQVMAELARRTDALTADTRAGLEEMRVRLAELERKKLNVADFGSALAMLGQRLASLNAEDSPRV